MPGRVAAGLERGEHTRVGAPRCRRAAAPGPQAPGWRAHARRGRRRATRSPTYARRVRAPRTRPRSTIVSATPGTLMSLSRRIELRCASGAWTANTRKNSRMSSGGPLPQKLMPSRPPGRSTRYASASASSQPPQIPLTEIATSNDPSAQGRSYIDPTRRSASGVRARATAISASAASMPATVAPVPSREADGESGTARDVEQRRCPDRRRAAGTSRAARRPRSARRGRPSRWRRGPTPRRRTASRDRTAEVGGRVGRRHRPILTMRAAPSPDDGMTIRRIDDQRTATSPS